jgi:hypothetical protein
MKIEISEDQLPVVAAMNVLDVVKLAMEQSRRMRTIRQSGAHVKWTVQLGHAPGDRCSKVQNIDGQPHYYLYLMRRSRTVISECQDSAIIQMVDRPAHADNVKRRNRAAPKAKVITPEMRSA